MDWQKKNSGRYPAIGRQQAPESGFGSSLPVHQTSFAYRSFRPFLLGLVFFIAFCSSGFKAWAADKPSIYVITTASSINPQVSEFVGRNLAKAEREKAAALIIEHLERNGLLRAK